MMGLYNKILFLAWSFLFAALLLTFQLLSNSSAELWTSLFIGVAAGWMLSLSILFFWIRSQRPSPRQTLWSVIAQLIIGVATFYRGRQLLQRSLRACKDPMSHQERLLKRILRKNKDTVYARECRLHNVTSLDDFRSMHAVVDYERYRPFIDRIILGERDILFKGNPDAFCRSSGTTGRSKLVPCQNRMRKKSDIIMHSSYVHREVHDLNCMHKILYLFIAPPVELTPTGLKVQVYSGIPKSSDWLLAGCVTPPAGFGVGTMYEALYVHLLFGLLDPGIETMVAGFLNIGESAIAILEKSWKLIVEDVRLGTIHRDLNIPADIREKLMTHLQTYGGDPHRAAQLQTEFESGFQGILKRLWPNLKTITAVDSNDGWLKFTRLYAEGIYFESVFYNCTESELGYVPGKRSEKGYIPLVDDVVYEFIKEADIMKDQPSTLLLDEVKKGECYELVITQPYGLYRYRNGDVVRIHDFYENTPVIEFMYRTGQILNLRTEKLDQRILAESLRAAVDRWPGQHTIREFAAAESTDLGTESPVFEPKEIMPYYLLFLELDRDIKILSDDEMLMVDEEIRSRSSEFDRHRCDESISRPRVFLVRSGTFKTLQEYLVANTVVTPNQYKVPRKLRAPQIDILIQNLV